MNSMGMQGKCIQDSGGGGAIIHNSVAKSNLGPSTDGKVYHFLMLVSDDTPCS